MSDDVMAPDEKREEHMVSHHLEALCQGIESSWKRNDNRYRVIRRSRLHQALVSNGYGTIDLDGIGIQKVRDLEVAERAATDIESRGVHSVEWPIREWLLRGHKLNNEMYVVRERDSRSAVGFVGYKREIECEMDDEVAIIYATFDLSAIYIAPDYSGTGLATALFHPMVSDMQTVIDHAVASYRNFERKGGRLAVEFALTGQAESAGGAACARSLCEALEAAVLLSSRNRRQRGIFAQEPVRDYFDYGDQDLWRDTIDGFQEAA